MENTSNAGLIELASSILIFLAAVIPVSYAIWSKAKTAKDKALIISRTFIIANFVLVFSALFIVMCFQNYWISAWLLLCSWFVWASVFTLASIPPSRPEIMVVIVLTFLVLGIFNLAVLNEIFTK